MPGGSSSSRDDANETTSRALLRRLPARVRAQWRFKAALAVAIGALFTAAYLLIGHFPVAPVRHLPLTWLDRAIGFHPYAWVWIYQSVYVPINLIPWLADRRDDLRRYVAGFLLLTLVSFAVFVAWPIRAPKPPVENPRGMYWLLQQYDAPYNSLPSLHAALLVYTLAFGRRIVGDETPRRLKLICVAWAGLILYGTLATKEHYAVDIVAGVAFGLVADRWAWRAARRGGLLQDAQQERADVPGRLEVVVRGADGVELARQVGEVAQQDPAAVVRPQGG
jgi:membrane-associated phospholipid phosphatase